MKNTIPPAARFGLMSDSELDNLRDGAKALAEAARKILPYSAAVGNEKHPEFETCAKWIEEFSDNIAQNLAEARHWNSKNGFPIDPKASLAPLADDRREVLDATPPYPAAAK